MWSEMDSTWWFAEPVYRSFFIQSHMPAGEAVTLSWLAEKGRNKAGRSCLSAMTIYQMGVNGYIPYSQFTVKVSCCLSSSFHSPTRASQL